MNVYKLKSTNRICYPFPWESQKTPCPWDRSKYERIVIPFTEVEKMNSRKLIHIQIVRKEKLEVIKETTLKIK